MANFKIALGTKVKDSVTGFAGVVTGRADYVTGCRQYLVSAKGTKSKTGETGWFDEGRLIGEKIQKRDTGGPQANPAPAK